MQGINVKLLERVKQIIVEYPFHFDMKITIVTQVRHRDYRPLDGIEIPSQLCGTVACIGGLVCIQEGCEDVDNPIKTAKELLGLTDDEAEELFFYSGWDEPYCEQYLQAVLADDTKRQAELAVEYIDYFIAKKSVAPVAY